MFEYLRMPLGLRNATQTLQRFMDSLLRDLPFAHCYLDDIIVTSHSHEEHLQHLRTLFQVLQRAGLSIKLGKCVLGREQVDFLGYTISSQGFRPPERKVEAISKFPTPTTSTMLRRFLGMFNHYRRCIPRAAHLQAPLNRLLAGKGKKRRIPIAWPTEAEAAFQACKKALRDAATNTFLSPSEPLAVASDASSTDIGAALDQLQGGVWRPVDFFSRELSPTEQKYSTYDRELLGAFAAVKSSSACWRAAVSCCAQTTSRSLFPASSRHTRPLHASRGSWISYSSSMSTLSSSKVRPTSWQKYCRGRVSSACPPACSPPTSKQAISRT